MQQTEIGRDRRPDSETRDRVRIKQEIIDAEVKVKVKQEVQVKLEEENNTNYENGFAVDQDLERKTEGNFGRNCPTMHPAYRAVGGPGPPNSFGFSHFFPPNSFGIPNFMDPHSQHSEQDKIHFSKNFLHPRQEKMKDLDYRNYEQKFDMYHFRTPPEFSQLIQQQHSMRSLYSGKHSRKWSNNLPAKFLQPNVSFRIKTGSGGKIKMISEEIS